MEEIITTVGKIAITAFGVFALVAIVAALTNVNGGDGTVTQYIQDLITTIFAKANDALESIQ